MRAPMPVTLRGNVPWTYTWTRDYSISVLCKHLRYLTSHDFRVINGIAKKLGIDLYSRIRQDNRVNFREAGDKIRESRHINKAMSMELLIALLLTWLDTAGQVKSGCCAKHGLPNYYSPQGLADVTASYQTADDEPAFRVVGEVSIRRKVTAKHYQKQLEQACRHAWEESEKNDGIPVYGLVINSGKITNSKTLQNIFHKCQSDFSLEQHSNIRLLPMYTRDFMNIMKRLSIDDTYAFDSGTLAKVFDSLCKTLNQTKLPKEQNWMVDDWLKIVNAAYTPELDLEESLEEKLGNESKPE